MDLFLLVNLLAVVRSHLSNDIRTTIFSSTEPKFVIYLQKSPGKILCSTRQTQFYILLVFFSRGLLVSAQAVSAPVISICQSFWPDQGRGKQQLTSFRAHFLNLFQRLKTDQFRVSFNVEHVFSQNW